MYVTSLLATDAVKDGINWCENLNNQQLQINNLFKNFDLT
jgi:hypothetical protein